jgi:hypothetical protein
MHLTIERFLDTVIAVSSGATTVGPPIVRAQES